MSIIIQFNSSAFSQSAVAVPSTNQCHTKRGVKLEMVPGIEHSDVSGMTDDENSIDVANSSIFSTTLKEVRINNHFGSCYGLPYQDHNYGAPPPPTPPSHSPCPSPVPSVPVPDEDTTLSVISNTTNEETQEESVTRCICGFVHDDEYMICCDNCLVWQHVDCMGLDRNNIPDTYLCDKCEPRKLDRHKAKLLQSKKKNSLTALKPSIASPTKQEQNFNNRIFGKNFKKKSVGQNSEEGLSTNKNEYREIPSTLQQFYYSSDSEDGINRNLDRRPKTRSKRRKREEEKSLEICEQTGRKKSKRHGKERMEAKRSKLRRGKNKESTSTADEEAQDAWEYSLEWCEKNFEDAINNQYTPEIQHLARTFNIKGFEKRYLEQMRTKQCHAYDDGKRKQLVCLRDLPRNSPLIEYKGKFLLASQFHDIHPLYNKRLYPYVLFYVLEQEEICVDASMYGNDARFVRRSCKPNAEIRHMVYNGKLHLYLTSTKVIFREDEVTIPLIVHPNDSLKDFECCCGTDDCLVKPKKKNGTIEVCHERRRRTRRSTVTADEDSNNSMDLRMTRHQTKVNPPPEKPKQITVKTEPVELPIVPTEVVAVTPIKEEPEVKSISDYECEEPANGGKRKQTREERKLDAILRHFHQMEQAEKRKQLALEKQKSQPKAEVLEEKPLTEPKKEEKLSTEVIESTFKEEEKVAPQTPKSKKGKRRRGSGTPSRRRTRTNSGGSDLMSLDESSPSKPSQSADTNQTLFTENIIQVPVSSPPPASASGLISPVPTVNPTSPHVLKTKRSLMNEWLQEKSEAAVCTPVSSPLPIHTEMKWNMSSAVATCYVRCTKDTPHSSGISAAHLRRSNSAGHMKPTTGQGSAKKRWLRQAMYDCHGCEIKVKFDSCALDPPSNMDNGCLSPNSHGDIDSINGTGEDVVTPLKKRRLMRESIESLPSPQSPSTATSIEDTDATTVSNSLISDNSTEHGIDIADNEQSCIEKDNLSPLLSEDLKNSVLKMSTDETEEKDTKNDEDLKVEPSSTPIPTVELVSKENKECIEEKESSEETTSEVGFENESIVELSQSTDLNQTVDMDNANPKVDSQLTEIHANLEPSDELTSLMEKNGSPSPEFCKSKAVSENQISSDTIESKVSVEHLVAQEQLQNISTANIASSSVNNAVLIELDNASSTNHSSCPSKVNSKSLNISESLPIGNKDSKSELKNISMQEDNKNIFTNNNEKKSFISEVNAVKDSSQETEQLVNKHDGHSTNDSSTNSLNQVACKFVSSCNNVDNSSYSVQLDESDAGTKAELPEAENVKLEEIGVHKTDQESMEVEHSEEAKTNGNFKEAFKSDSLSRCTLNEDTSLDTKSCASATQKRKVSLSEYRMRMRENTGKIRSNLENTNKSNIISTACAISFPDTLPDKVSLAPLPLFEKVRNRKPLLKQPVQHSEVRKKKDVVKKEVEKEGDITEHRENLNERLKREFGFDVSEGSTNSLNSKIPSTSGTDVLKLLGARPSPPPPPPPPRLMRPAQPDAKGVAIPPSRFNFTPPPFPRPQYMISQVPGAPYLPPQPPILPPVHPNPAQCSLQPPLLPSAHPFNPSMTLLRPPQREYTPANAQQFAALVQQPPPPPPHKSYIHVYPYK